MTAKARIATGVVSAALGAALLVGCGVASGSPATRSSRAGASGSKTLVVFAAASLTNTFTRLGKDFEAAHPGVDVQFSFAGSSTLVSQIEQGAPADVFASADQKNMRHVVDAKLIRGTPWVFARNKLTIVVPKGNPGHVNSVAALADPAVQVVVCASQVPCGSATRAMEAKAHLVLRPVSEESQVTDVLAKVAAGDADAGLVYVTDAESANPARVSAISIPDAVNAVNNYPIGVVAGTANGTLASQFIALVRGTTGQKVLAAAGFLPPAG